MKNLSSKIYIAALFIIVSLGLVIFKITGVSSSKGEDVGVVTRQDLIQRVTIAGAITPFKKTLVITPFNGYVKKLFVQVGDRVKQGDPLVSIVQSLQNGDGSFPLRSPLDGVIVQIGKTEGEFVKDGDPKEFILRIDDNRKYFALADAAEIDRVKLKIGQEAIVRVSAILDKTYKGVIRELSLAAKEKDLWGRSSQSVEFTIKIEITDSDEKLNSGMSVVVDVITAKKEKVLMLRHEFIRREGEKYFIIMKSGERRDIQVGLQNEEGFEITSGLKEGEEVKQVDFTELSTAE
jgi:multidrug efflux pump subunit AcrA (membrane-fusion protein)